MKYHLLSLFVVALWGVTFISTKILINSGLLPSHIFAIRFAIAYAGIWILCAKNAKTRKVFSGNLKDELVFVLMGLTGGSLYFLAENTALACTQACNVSFIVCSAPLLTALMTLAAKKHIDGLEDISGRWTLAVGSIMALCGIAAVTFDETSVQFSVEGDLLALGAALCWGIYSIFMGQMTLRYGALFATRKVFFYGLVTIIPFLAGTSLNLSILARTDVWGHLLFLSIGASLLCFVLWNKAMSKIGNVTATNYVYLNPLFTLVAAVAILGESLTVQSAAGCAAILAGVVIGGINGNSSKRKSSTLFLTVLFAIPVHSEDYPDLELKYKSILLRDFRTVHKGKIINYNIGTSAHCPATLNLLQKYLPEEVDITIWASRPLDSTLSVMMRRRFPDIKIVSGSYESPPEESAGLQEAVSRSDLFLVSSGNGIAVGPSLLRYHEVTGKPVGAYAIGYGKSEDKYLQLMDFAWFRDEISARKALGSEATPAINGWAPDAVFDFDCTDEEGARKFLAAHHLESGKFICCIPGFRNTPRWEFYGTAVNEKKQAQNEEYLDRDNEILRRTIIQTVRSKGTRVLICAEQIPEVRLCKEVIYDKLPDDVKPYCTYITQLWAPDLALAVYRHSLLVYGIEMHSQVMAVGNGTPAAIFRHSGFGSKSDMWNTIGLGDWLLDIDDPNAGERACEIVNSILERPQDAAEKVARARDIIDAANRAAIKRSFFRQKTSKVPHRSPGT